MGRTITAYTVGDTAGWTLEPASPSRSWIEDTGELAGRCLPITIANQAGWVIGCPADFVAIWSGGSDAEATGIQLAPGSERYASAIQSHFGHGLITFTLPWLFRTPAGLWLQVRGASNYFKHHVVACEGLVETDWAPMTFTMNWRILEADRVIRFSKGEPICMIAPYSPDLLESFDTAVKPVDSEPDLAKEFHTWRQSRSQIAKNPKARSVSMQQSYADGPGHEKTANTHRTHLTAKPFPVATTAAQSARGLTHEDRTWRSTTRREKRRRK